MSITQEKISSIKRAAQVVMDSVNRLITLQSKRDTPIDLSQKEFTAIIAKPIAVTANYNVVIDQEVENLKDLILILQTEVNAK